MKVIVSGGGTGGHIYPAVAIAQGILKEFPDSEVLYVGTEEGMESRIVPTVGLPFVTVAAKGWQGRKPDQLIKAITAIYQGEKQAKKILKEFQPDLIIGTGGYVCLPVAAAAVKKRIPVYIHEQNAFPGLTNRLISIWAKGVMITFEESRNYLPKSARNKVILTGLPIRQEIITMTRERSYSKLGLEHDKLTLLVVGGSRGAKSINNAMLHVIEALYGNPKVQLLHACGQRDYQMMVQRLKEKGIPYEGQGNIILKPYIDDMEYALGAADLCVGRAGAAFIAEVTALGVPSILIPYPYASGDHQTYNAKSLVSKKAAILIEDKKLNGPFLLKNIENILKDQATRNIMKANSLLAGHPNALKNILKVLKK